ncbi:FHA domain-containing protein [Streptomyces sp. NPDC006544]|uniref:FHA domain-containing protein n=1 Tax=Streptomyces sp. NPDC006544 TaxID=3154583 RepID=UPI0033AFDB34
MDPCRAHAPRTAQKGPLTAMQIRLTVLGSGSRSGHHTAATSTTSAAAPASCDVLVTAPAGTALSAVASGLAATVGGPDTGGTVVLYAGTERLDPARCALGEPPLVDGAVLSLHLPGPEVLADAGPGDVPRLHVVAGPDAGGVHLLHPGAIRIGRSADADVPLDDPDVSRLHCAVTVLPDGRVAVADLGSTNGTTLDAAVVGAAPVALAPGALLRIGESTLRLAAGPTPPSLPLTPDLEGHLSLGLPGDARTASPGSGDDGSRTDATAHGGPGTGPDTGAGRPPAGPPGAGTGGSGPGSRPAPGPRPGASQGGHDGSPGEGPGTARGSGARPEASRGRTSGSSGGGAGGPGTGTGSGDAGTWPGRDNGGGNAAAGPWSGTDTRGGSAGTDPWSGRDTGGRDAAPGGSGAGAHLGAPGAPGAGPWSGASRAGGPGGAPGGAHGAGPTPPGSFPHQASRSGGLAPDPARPEARHGGTDGDTPDADPRGSGAERPGTGRHHAPSTGVEHHGDGGWAAPGAAPGLDRGDGGGSPEPRRPRRGIGAWARKWVRGEDSAQGEAVGAAAAHAGATASVAARPGADDPAALLLAALGPTPRLWAGPPGLDVTLGVGSGVALLETGALGIAGPRARLTGVARSVIAQLAALHAPGQRLEIVLIAADRGRPLAERRRDWGWLGWLPHVRPAHGQDCRLLLAYDRDQAAARVGELTRRIDDGPLGTHWAGAGPDAVREAAHAYRGPYTLLVLDGDPGAGALRDLTGRLASHGPAAGIHLLALAESPAATPASPVAETYETACAATPAFRDCGAVALLSGDVATAVRTFAVRGGKPVPPGETAVADAVSVAWAERFARALAPLKADSPPTEGYRPTAATLPATSRLLDELGLARATPASLMARWAAATDQGQRVGGLAEIVLGTGRRGPVGAELVTDGPHLLIEGPAGSGRTELLRSVAASLSAAARPDRLGLVLLDGAGGERGDGLLACTELPHVSAHLVASDPLRMRAFAQALGAELKRRAELLDGVPFPEWHARRGVSDRMVSPRQPTPGELRGDLEPQRTGTLRLRASAVRSDPAAGPSPLPRLVVLVDDFDALVAPGLGSTGRPAAGSVVRALEAVAREGARLGVHLVATSARPDRTADTELARLTTLRVELDAPDQPAPGRGVLRYADGRTVPFQGGRVTGRIPRTATQRPTVVPVEWERMGDPPARRPVRELGNGPTDLALLASALDRASHLVSAVPVLFPPAP